MIQLSNCAGIFPVLVRNAVTQHELVHPEGVGVQQGIRRRGAEPDAWIAFGHVVFIG